MRLAALPTGSRSSRSLAAASCLVGVISLTLVARAQQMPRPDPSLPDPSLIERHLPVEAPGAGVIHEQALSDALQALRIPSVSITLIDQGALAWTHAYGPEVTPATLFQAASLSKLVSAVAVLRLVDKGVLELDRDVTAYGIPWRPDQPSLTHDHPVTLRGLLSMTGGIGVPGYVGYSPGAALPSLAQILDGGAPANSASVRVLYVPGTRYAYSGGGYEIAQAVVQAVTHRSFDDAVGELVFRPLGMTDSRFAQPLPPELSALAAMGHGPDGAALPGGWRVVPELAAGGLWSTPTDLAKLLLDLGRAYRGEAGTLLSRGAARAMLTPQNGGPYGLGGAVSGSGRSVVLMKRGQNVGYQAYMLIFPELGQGIVVMTGSDNGTVLASAIIRRAATLYGWPELGPLLD